MKKIFKFISIVVVITFLMGSITSSAESKDIQPSLSLQQEKKETKIRMLQKPNDQYLEEQYYLKTINAETAWDELTESDVVVAILDTGVDLTHPDLQSNLVEGINLLDKEKPPLDDNGHGTNVAGIVAGVGNNHIGISGVSWKAKIMPIKVLDKNGEAENSFFVGQGIRYAVDNGAKVILLSLGEPVLTAFMYEAVQYAKENGVLIIAAAGNNQDLLNYPAALPDVLAVGAVDHQDKYASYSNTGQQIDVVAPGDDIYTTKVGGGYMTNSGTSMAAPQVAGLAALIFQKYPQLDGKDVADLIKFTADDVGDFGWDQQTGYGRINAARALTAPLTILSDGYEPNQTMDTAHTFPLEDRFTAQLADRQDVDWYQVILPYAGKLNISFTLDQRLEQGIQLEVIPADKAKERWLLEQNEEETLGTKRVTPQDQQNTEGKQAANPVEENSDQENIVQTEETSLASQEEAEAAEPSTEQETPPSDNLFQIKKEQTVILDLPAGTSYLKIAYVQEQKEAIEQPVSYTISNHYTIYQDPYEPNDKPWQAFLVKNLHQPMTGTLHQYGDQDWFKIQLNQSGILSAVVSTDTIRMDPILGLQPIGGIEKHYDYQGSGNEEFGYIHVSPGEYLIYVTDYNQYAVIGEYQLQLQFKSDDGDNNEPNDTSSEAVPFEVSDRMIEGVIFDQEDDDWFAFTVDKPTYLTMDFSADQRAETIVYNEHLEGIWTEKEAKWNHQGLMEAGSYYIRIDSIHAGTKYRFYVDQIPLVAGFIDIKDHWATDAIIKLHGEGIINGYEDHTFRPNREITKAEVAKIISEVLNLQEEAEPAFTDVTEEAWYYSAIAKLYHEAIIQDNQAHLFYPDQPITRGELIQILAKAYQIPIIADATPGFTDVSVEHVAYQEINTFAQLGLVLGYKDQTFRPNRTLTRAEFVTMLERLRDYRDAVAEQAETEETETTETTETTQQ